MKHETIEVLIAGRIRGWDIKPEDALPFTPGVLLECYAGIAVRAGIYNPEKYGMRFIQGILKVFKAFAKKGILIKKIYAVSDTADGIKISRELGFEESPSVTK